MTRSLPYNIELEFFRKDGSRFWGDNTLTLVRDADGVPVNILGTARDISARRRAEAERQALLEIMQGAVSTNDLPEFLKLVHSKIASVIPADNFYIALHNKESGLFEMAYYVDQYDQPPDPACWKKGKSPLCFPHRETSPDDQEDR